MTRLETSEAVAAERMKHIQESLRSIDANNSRIVWLIITAIIGGLMAFLLNGGLKIGG